ncbi:MAG: PspA/IM30 family protein [Bdellovibrionota bacterium]
MAITKRILRLFKADIHGIIDCLEDPETMLRQAVRDMEEEIAEGEAELLRLNEQEECRERAKKHSAELKAETERQIELCFDTGNEALARTFVRRKLECEQRLKLIVQREATLTAEKVELERRLRAQQEKLASVKEKMEIFCKVQHSTCEAKHRTDDFFVSDEQIEVAMLEERRRRQEQSVSGRAA